MKQYRFCIVNSNKEIIQYHYYYNQFKSAPDPFMQDYIKNLDLSPTQEKRINGLRQGNIVTIGSYLGKSSLHGTEYLAIKCLTDDEVSTLTSSKNRINELDKEIKDIREEYKDILSKLSKLEKERSSLNKSIK